MESPQLPTTSFDPEADCKRLHLAIEAEKPNKKTIIDVFSKRTSRQRKTIVHEYYTMFSTNLVNQLQTKLCGAFKNLVVSMCYTVEELDAMVIKSALDESRTDDQALIRVLGCRNRKEIVEIEKAYSRLFYQCELKADIKMVTNGDFLNFLLALLSGWRLPNREIEKAEECPTSPSSEFLAPQFDVFYRMLVYSSKRAGKRTIQTRAATTWKYFNDLIAPPITDNSVQLGFCMIAEYLIDGPIFFARLLKASMEEIGTNESLFTHTLLSRCDIDLDDIKLAFQNEMGEPLKNMIKDKTSGNYMKMLLELVGD